MHVIERLILTVFWRAFFFQILSLRLTPFVHLSTEVRCCVSHSTVCSWLGVVWAMMFNRGILFYSKWPFGQSQHIKEKQSFSFVNSSSLDWMNMKQESPSKVHQRGARAPGQRRAGQLVVYKQSQTAWCFPLWNMHNHSLSIVSAFSFLPFRAISS